MGRDFTGTGTKYSTDIGIASIENLRPNDAGKVVSNRDTHDESESGKTAVWGRVPTRRCGTRAPVHPHPYVATRPDFLLHIHTAVLRVRSLPEAMQYAVYLNNTVIMMSSWRGRGCRTVGDCVRLSCPSRTQVCITDVVILTSCMPSVCGALCMYVADMTTKRKKVVFEVNRVLSC